MGTTDDIQDLIYTAWKRIRPRLEDEPALLAQRLQRRRTPTLTRPPRAWCIALRASDHRLLSRVFPSHLPFGDPQFNPDDHALTITTPVLRSITAPITLTAPGETLADTATKLGTSPAGLLSIRLNQTVRTHHIPPTGYKGRLQPLLYIEHPLDPCAKGFRPQDALWSWTSTFLATRIPERFEQTLRRIAVYRPHVPRHRYDEFAHPELACPERATRVDGTIRSKRLPEPLIEPTCWYKWSASGHFLGTDPTNWRKDFKDLGNRPRRDRPTPWRNRKRPALSERSESKGSLHFNGYQWLCPACGKSCRTIYLPVEPINLLKRMEPRLAKCIDIPKSKIAGTFACSRCHRVQFPSQVNPDYWNQMIAYITAGLLYGREVRRPAWFIPKRKRAYKPLINRPSPRREQVFDRLLQGHTRAQIAAELHMTYGAVSQQMWKIFKQYKVRTQRALILAHKKPLPPRLLLTRERILHDLKAGAPIPHIARKMKITQAAVQSYISQLRKSGHLPRPKLKMHAIAKLLAIGLSNKAIASQLGLKLQSIYDTRRRLRHGKRLRNRARATASLVPA